MSRPTAHAKLSALDQLNASCRDVLLDLFDQLYNKSIPLAEFEAGAITELRRSHTQAAMIGRGHTSPLSQDEMGVIDSLTDGTDGLICVTCRKLRSGKILFNQAVDDILCLRESLTITATRFGLLRDG